MNELSDKLNDSFLLDVVAFALGLLCAWYFAWNTTDLVWSLWLGSLVLGYLTILSVIGAGVFLGRQLLGQAELQAGGGSNITPGMAKAIGGGLAVFLLGFFTLHFCGFHAGHAVFLSSFFPLEGLDENAFGPAFMNPPLLWYLVFTKILPQFGLFLIPVAIAERHALMRPFKQARDFVQKQRDKTENTNPHLVQRGNKKQNPLQEAFIGPYRNVIRMHLLIFVFAGLSVFGLESFGVFAIVYAVYFFPWRLLKNCGKGAEFAAA